MYYFLLTLCQKYLEIVIIYLSEGKQMIDHCIKIRLAASVV
jgi:hypothetical protein